MVASTPNSRLLSPQRALRKLLVFSVALFLVFTVALPRVAFAHCPLCTIGAGGAAAGAAWLGVNSAVIGVFLGAFGLALGLWTARLIKKQYVKYQSWLIGLASFIATVFPLRPIFGGQGSYYLSIAGDYGSLLNRTYLFDPFLIGSFVGAALLVAAPYLSKRLAKVRGGKLFPYQGVSITFVLLIGSSLIIQLAL